MSLRINELLCYCSHNVLDDGLDNILKIDVVKIIDERIDTIIVQNILTNNIFKIIKHNNIISHITSIDYFMFKFNTYYKLNDFIEISKNTNRYRTFEEIYGHIIPEVFIWQNKNLKI